MYPPKIQFQQERDLGEIISDSFKFLRENYKPLIGSIAKITAPVFFILLLAIGFYSYLGMDLLENPFFGMSNSNGMGEMYFISLFVLLFSLLAFYVLLNVTVLHFIRSYVQGDGIAHHKEVLRGVKSDFGGMLGLLLLIGIGSFLGLLLCILPGIYLWVPFSLAPAAMVLGRHSVIGSLENAFTLIKNNWWTSFFTLLLMVVLVYIIGLIFQLPLIFYIFFKALTSSTEASMADPSTLFDWVYVVFNVISSMAQYLLSSIVIIASAFLYYSLDEKKNFSGSYKTISNLGSSQEQ